VATHVRVNAAPFWVLVSDPKIVKDSSFKHVSQTNHVIATRNGRGVHHGDSIVLVGWDPDHFLGAQCNLDLTGISGFNHPTSWDFKLIPSFMVVPNVVTLRND
jgi:hypothetical protein